MVRKTKYKYEKQKKPEKKILFNIQGKRKIIIKKIKLN